MSVLDAGQSVFCFWLTFPNRAKTHLELLAVAANVAQGANTHCDHVLLLFAKLFKIYTSMIQDEGAIDGRHPISAILESLKK
jgi:hypothetical protein